MSTSKDLTARVKLDTKDAEDKLKRLDNLIKSINKAVTGRNNTGQLEKKLAQQLKLTEKVAQETEKTKLQQQKVATEAAKTALQQQKVQTEVARTALAQERVHKAQQKTKQEQDKLTQAVSAWNKKLNASKSIFSGIGSLVKRIAGTLLGLGTIKLAIQGADTLTGAENRLNNIAGRQLGDAAYTFDSGGNKTGYSEAASKFSRDAMDKMYVAAQNSRSLYSDMMANVSKTMTLAPSAFQDNIDYAIRFQEIMAKAYTVGGASAQEMSTSMYQLTQALGSGVLQGDELRSVREGAPLAYQAIEKFAQGVYKTTDSLKDMASEGQISSEMVVAAIMNMGDEIDQTFALTKWRFSEVWNSIKSSAQRAFQPVVAMLTDVLNKAVDNGLIEKAQTFFTNLAKAAMIAITAISKAIDWMADNWNWLQHIVLGVIAAIITWTIIKAVIGIWAAYVEFKANAIAAYGSMAAWKAAQATMIKTVAIVAIIVLAIMALIYVVYLWRNGTIDTCTAITSALLIVAAAILLIGIITGSVAMIIIAIVLMLLAVIFMFFAEIMGGIFVVGAFFKNVWFSIGNIFFGIVEWCKAIWHNFVALCVNLMFACGNSIGAIFDNIGIWWNNICANMKAAFWDFIASCISAISGLAPVIEAVASVFGKDISISGMVDNARAKADAARASRKEYEDVGAAWRDGMSTMAYKDASAAYAAGASRYDTWQDGWASDAYNNGYDWGSNVKNSINEWGSQFQKTNDGLGKTNLLDNWGEKLGLDFDDKFNFPTEESLGGGGVGRDYQPDNNKLLGNIDDNTGKMADSMELTEEDLEYLRRVADMEWKKEFTTANIVVDMTNNNNINGTNDLDGIVTYLSEKLYEEMDAIAHGVYA